MSAKPKRYPIPMLEQIKDRDSVIKHQKGAIADLNAALDAWEKDIQYKATNKIPCTEISYGSDVALAMCEQLHTLSLIIRVLEDGEVDTVLLAVVKSARASVDQMRAYCEAEAANSEAANSDEEKYPSLAFSSEESITRPYTEEEIKFSSKSKYCQ